MCFFAGMERTYKSLGVGDVGDTVARVPDEVSLYNNPSRGGGGAAAEGSVGRVVEKVEFPRRGGLWLGLTQAVLESEHDDEGDDDKGVDEVDVEKDESYGTHVAGTQVIA